MGLPLFPEAPTIGQPPHPCDPNAAFLFCPCIYRHYGPILCTLCLHAASVSPSRPSPQTAVVRAFHALAAIQPCGAVTPIDHAILQGTISIHPHPPCFHRRHRRSRHHLHWHPPNHHHCRRHLRPHPCAAIDSSNKTGSPPSI
jgi:hypothetical protein